MSAHCHHHDLPRPEAAPDIARYRRVLWVALWVNAAMFGVDIVSSLESGSRALLADAIDFGGDALNYAVSLAVLASAVKWRARAALVKAASMVGFAAIVLGSTVWAWWQGHTPEPKTMGAVAVLALVSNLGVAWLLYAHRQGDANMRSVWLCSRNDALGNLAVMAAAVGVGVTGAAWPDALVAALMAVLAAQGGWVVWRQARQELAQRQVEGPTV